MKKLSLFPRKVDFLSLSSIVCYALIVVSCSNDYESSSVMERYRASSGSRSGESFLTIDTAVAKYAAYKLMNAPVDGQSAPATKTISNTTTICNRYGESVMFAIDFDSGGYVVLSASKSTSPIVASSLQGSFDTAIASPFMEHLIDNAKTLITESFDYHADSMMVYARQWESLIPPVKYNLHKSRAENSSSYQAIIDRTIREWESQNLEVYEAMKWLRNGYGNCVYLPDLEALLAKFNMPVNWADGKPMNELSYIVVRHTLTYATSGDKCNPVTTKWNTNPPYNASVPGGFPLSSEAVALGRILHYLDDPSVLNFSASTINPLQNDTEVANFLYDVAKKINTSFGASYSYATYGNLLDAIATKYGYAYETGIVNDQNLLSSINNGSPSIIIEYDKSGRSHAWVCDGYRVVDDRIDYFLMVPVGQPEDMFGPYEPSAQWDEQRNSNVQFNNSDASLYFNTFFEGGSTKEPVYTYIKHKERE